MNSDTQAAQVLRLAAEHGLVRSRDLTAAMIPRATLMRLVRSGQLKQIARGLYALPDQPLSRQHSLAAVAACVDFNGTEPQILDEEIALSLSRFSTMEIVLGEEESSVVPAARTPSDARRNDAA